MLTEFYPFGSNITGITTNVFLSDYTYIIAPSAAAKYYFLRPHHLDKLVNTEFL
jgi:hypothetical protein